MYRLDDRDAELAVISNELIKDCVNDDDDARNINAINERDQSVDFTALRSLTMSFKNIFKIDNLVTLDNLISLKLDNNVIKDIENISHLKNLTWLDLSFNNISEIQGLDTLTKLTDLTLYNNNISKIKNMEMLSNLQVFSIGNNNLQTTEGLLYLRCLEKLKVLNLDGNPVCADPEYRSFVLAHLDKLKYLDYALVDANEVTLAREQYQDELEEWKEIKVIEDAAKIREKDNEEYTAKLRDANVIILETLFSDMFKEDVEIAKLQILPGLQNLIDDYSDKVKAATEDVKSILLEKHGKMIQEHTEFQSAIETVQKKTQKKSIEKVEEYQRIAKRAFKQATSGNEATIKGSLNEAQKGNDFLISELMNLETELTEQCHNLIDILEAQVEKMGSEAKDISTEHFRAVEELENNYFEAVSQLASVLLERVAAEDMEDDDLLSDECKAILNDRDLLNNAINGSHDIHIGKLLSQEDTMREEGIRKTQEIIKKAKDAELERNRSRVAEIIHLKERNRSAINEIKEDLNRVDDDFD